jgi:hypothetical protein
VNVSVLGCAVCGPGVPDWESAQAVLRGDVVYDASRVRDPAPVALPPNERRRLPPTARAALGIGGEALQASALDPRGVATVFTSCGSDGQITHQICEALARPAPEISPTRFHNSVHNAPGGYWSIAFATHAPSTSLCAGEGSFAAGLLEAAAQATVEAMPVLLVAYDVPYPEPLLGLWNAEVAFACALVLVPGGREGLATFSIDLADEPATGWPAAIPEALARNPAAQSLRMLAAMTGATNARVVLPYHRERGVAVERVA